MRRATFTLPLVAPLLATLLLVGAACQKNAGTPPGTEILRWDASKATRRSVATAAEIGPRATKDMTFRARPERKGTATFAVHVETAPIEVDEGGKRSRQTAPVAVRVTVERNADWTLQARCADGPNYRMPSAAGATPEEMVLSCDVSMVYQDTFNDVTYLLTLEIAGDGSVHPSLPDGWITPN